MLFNSWAYLLFLPTLFAVHWLTPSRFRASILLAGSWLFYGMWDVRFLGLMGLSILVDFIASLRMNQSSERGRKAWVTASVVTNLGILGAFKYFDFFSLSVARVLETVGLWRYAADPLLMNVVLPVGVSFYTFQSMAYTIDVYRKKIEPTPSLLHFALYVSFFPQLVAGPIERAKSLLPQLIGERRFADIRWKAAIWLLVWGLFKKIVIADNLSPVVARCLDTESVSGPVLFVGLLAFAFQILCDFSGYTDIARGSAMLFGVRLRTNFKLPYLALSPSDFWRRWHISLSTWLRDYLYIPLGGNRGTRAIVLRNLLLTMVLGGLWHGAAWNFVLWGAYHGLLLVMYRFGPGKGQVPAPRGWLSASIRWASFFPLTLIGWGLFRAQQPGQLPRFARALFDWHISQPELLRAALRDLSFLVIPLLVVMLIEKRDELIEAHTDHDDRPNRHLSSVGSESKKAGRQREFGDRFGLFGLTAATTFLLGCIAVWGATGGTEFIYFQF